MLGVMFTKCIIVMTSEKEKMKKHLSRPKYLALYCIGLSFSFVIFQTICVRNVSLLIVIFIDIPIVCQLLVDLEKRIKDFTE